MQIVKVLFVAVFLIALILTGCGGGGGSGSNSNSDGDDDGGDSTSSSYSWGTAKQVNTENGDFHDDPQFAVSVNGHAIVAWEPYGGDNADTIWANYYDGTNWNTAKRIDTGTYDAWDPQIAFDGDGHAIAIWTQYENDTQSIWANSFQ